MKTKINKNIIIITIIILTLFILLSFMIRRKETFFSYSNIDYDFTSPWQPTPIQSCCVLDVTQLQDGTIVGIGTNYTLWTKRNLNDNWQGPIQNSCCVISITQLQDGTILGIGLDYQLWSKKNLTDVWNGPIQNSCCIKSIRQLNDGTIIGVGTAYSNSKTWNITWQPKTGAVNVIQNNMVALTINIRDYGTVMNSNNGYGWGAEVWSSLFQNVPRPVIFQVKGTVNGFSVIYNGNVVQTFPNRFNITNFNNVTMNSTDGITVNVDASYTENNLYIKNKLTEQWDGPVENSCCVISIVQLSDDTILGIGTDNKLWSKNTLTDTWKGPIDNSCCVKSIIQLNDGTLLGVGMYNNLYTKKIINDSPRNLSLSRFQNMFNSVGCRKVLTENDVSWWRTRNTKKDVIKDMQTYYDLASKCAGNDAQNNFCLPFKCFESIHVSPATMSLKDYQNLYNLIGCKKTLHENDVNRWRSLQTKEDVINDMKNLYALASKCSGNNLENNLCLPGKCGFTN